MLAVSLKDLWSNGPSGSATGTGNDTTIFVAAGNFISNSLTWLLVLAGFVAVAFIIYGGYTMITAGGDSSKIENGKKMIIWAIVGIVVVGLAKGAVYYVVGLLHSPYTIPQT